MYDIIRPTAVEYIVNNHSQELNSGQIIDIWVIHHVFTFGCLLYPQERQQFWADQLGVRFLPFFNYGTQNITPKYTRKHYLS